MKTLQELTGQESGIVIYYDTGGRPEAIVCNWSSCHGFPRLDPMGFGIMGLGEDIPEVEGYAVDNIPGLLKGVEIIYAHSEDMPGSGMVYDIDENIKIIAPDDWA